MKKCYYELLEVDRNASEIELKKAYRRKALQYHPDKNPDSVEEATEIFASIRAAYEVLSDPQERAWYDSHREQILNDTPVNDDGDYEEYEVDSTVTGVTTEELLMFFNSSLYTKMDNSPAGIYQIAGRIFARLAKDEIHNGRRLGLDKFAKYQDDHFEDEISELGYLTAVDKHGYATGSAEYLFPIFGYSNTDYEYLKIFYKKWGGFSTLKSFSWKDEYMYSSTYDRRTKREINKRNEKSRQTARNEYNKTVKRFVTFIKKLDVRMKQGAKLAREGRETEEQKLKKGPKKIDPSTLKKNKAVPEFEEQSWQSVQDQDWDKLQKRYEDEIEESFHTSKEDINSSRLKSNTDLPTGQTADDIEEVIVFECYVCDKIFKSEKQLENHVSTNLHKKKIRNIQWEMKKESMALGLDDVSDIDEFDSAASEVEPDSPVIGKVEEDVDLDKLNEEIAQLERQLAEHDLEEDLSSSEDDLNVTGGVDDIDSLSEAEQSAAPPDIGKTIPESLPVSDNETESDSDDGIDARNDELEKLLASLNPSLADLNKSAGEDSDNSWSGNTNKKKSKGKGKNKTKSKSNQGSSTVNGSALASDQACGVEICVTCGSEFDSRNKLFTHVKNTGHAAPPNKVKGKKRRAKK